MYEYKVLRIERRTEEKTQDETDKKGRVTTKRFVAVETWEEFDKRVERTLNDWAREGWQAINANYSLSIITLLGSHGYPNSDFNSAGFVVLMQRKK